jgi:hypothetical protein
MGDDYKMVNRVEIIAPKLIELTTEDNEVIRFIWPVKNSMKSLEELNRIIKTFKLRVQSNHTAVVWNISSVHHVNCTLKDLEGITNFIGEMIDAQRIADNEVTSVIHFSRSLPGLKEIYFSPKTSFDKRCEIQAEIPRGIVVKYGYRG